jgi:hypothetical protein
MSEREAEPIFCSECQEEVAVDKARIVNGRVLCPHDFAKLSFFQRLGGRKLPENAARRAGRWFYGMFTSLAALMFVVGVAFIWKDAAAKQPFPGVPIVLASVFVGIFGIFVGDAIDLLLDISGELRRLNSGRR